MTDLRVSGSVVIAKVYFKGETARMKYLKIHETIIVRLTTIPLTMVVELPIDFAVGNQ